MPRYYLHIRTADGMLLDEEGIDLPDLNAARELALASARDLLGDAIKAGKGVVAESIVVADADGHELVIVPLEHALPDRFRD
jgi:hypothetical protein